MTVVRRRTAKLLNKRVARCPALETGVTRVLGGMGTEELKALYQRTTGVGHMQKGTVREKQISKIVTLSAFLKQKAIGVSVLRKFLVEHAGVTEPAAAKLRKQFLAGGLAWGSCWAVALMAAVEVVAVAVALVAAAVVVVVLVVLVAMLVVMVVVVLVAVAGVRIHLTARSLEL
ncbi:hypothetical protein T492DRAFT_869071 [Pavlovales sp. CCMP2436]|nr:hypothetical protein T492DRAFT_869071 [Pavlovales sp. CCMP2436]